MNRESRVILLQKKMKCFAALCVAIIAASLVGANPPGAPAVQPKPASSILPSLINFVNNLFANVRALLQLVVHGLAVAVNSVLEILVRNLLRLILLLAPGSTPVPVAPLGAALLALKNPTVNAVGAAILKLLDVELAGSVILYVYPKPIANTVVDVKLLANLLQGLNVETVPLQQLVQILGDYLLSVYKINL